MDRKTATLFCNVAHPGCCKNHNKSMKITALPMAQVNLNERFPTKDQRGHSSVGYVSILILSGLLETLSHVTWGVQIHRHILP